MQFPFYYTSTFVHVVQAFLRFPNQRMQYAKINCCMYFASISSQNFQPTSKKVRSPCLTMKSKVWSAITTTNIFCLFKFKCVILFMCFLFEKRGRLKKACHLQQKKSILRPAGVSLFAIGAWRGRLPVCFTCLFLPHKAWPQCKVWSTKK